MSGQTKQDNLPYRSVQFVTAEGKALVYRLACSGSSDLPDGDGDLWYRACDLWEGHLSPHYSAAGRQAWWDK